VLQRAAASLPVGERAHFLQSVAAHLSGQPTDDAVTAAINAALAIVHSLREFVENELRLPKFRYAGERYAWPRSC
jgi:hypothetical protein